MPQPRTSCSPPSPESSVRAYDLWKTAEAGTPSHYGGRMSGGRVALRWSVTAVLVVALTGCAPPVPEPTPAPTGFASEDEAFAAAEATYRAYVDGVNDARTSEDDSYMSLLSGEALRAEEEAVQLLTNRGWRIEGASAVKTFRGSWWSTTQAEALVCLDSSRTTVVDTTGEDVTPPGRPSTTELTIRVLWSDDRPTIAVSEPTGESC